MTLLKKNNIKVSGSGKKTMLFAHGYGCDQNMWRFVAPAFQADYRTVLFDHIGAGQSDLSAYSRTRYSTLNGYADDVLNICRELDLREVTFVGHSVSAMIGVLAALKEPERFEKLVLIGPRPATSMTATTSVASPGRTSTGCSSPWMTITWAGRARWPPSSWAIRIARSWGRS